MANFMLSIYVLFKPNPIKCWIARIPAFQSIVMLFMDRMKSWVAAVAIRHSTLHDRQAKCSFYFLFTWKSFMMLSTVTLAWGLIIVSNNKNRTDAHIWLVSVKRWKEWERKKCVQFTIKYIFASSQYEFPEIKFYENCFDIFKHLYRFIASHCAAWCKRKLFRC